MSTTEKQSQKISPLYRQPNTYTGHQHKIRLVFLSNLNALKFQIKQNLGLKSYNMQIFSGSISFLNLLKVSRQSLDTVHDSARM